MMANCIKCGRSIDLSSEVAYESNVNYWMQFDDVLRETRVIKTSDYICRKCVENESG